jgi:hypothetical protein
LLVFSGFNPVSTGEDFPEHPIIRIEIAISVKTIMAGLKL